MRIIYTDSEFKCHVTNDGTMTTVETEFFDGKCDAFIEGYCCESSGIPEARENGEVFTDGKIYPWKNLSELDVAQRESERHQLAEYESALAEIEAALGV